MLHPQRFKELSQRDITDQQQASSSREASPKRLRQLRRAHRFPPEQESKGESPMTLEMEMKHIKAERERQDNIYQASIQEITKQRVVKLHLVVKYS